MKNCSKCKKDKILDNFNKDKKNKDNLTCWCKSCFSEYNKKRIKNIKIKEKHYKRAKQWYFNNLEKAKKQNIDWIKNNREKYNKHHRERWNNDLEYKLKKLLRTKLTQSLKSKKSYKKTSALNLVGCTIEELKKYLESLFLHEMTWENHGKVWEIDHIKPCSSFDLTNLDQQKECFNYSNLKPIFKTSEISKNFGYVNYIGNRNKSNKIL